MQGNMNPAPRRGSPERRKAPGNVRRDINLLPANEGSEKAARWGTVILFALLGAALFAALAIYLPLTGLNTLKGMADGAEAQVQALQSAGAQFNERVNERNALLGMLGALEKSGADQSASDLMDQIGRACPDGITLHSVKISVTGANIAGRAPDDRAVAQFIENLRAIPEYQSVELTGVHDEEGAGSGTPARLFDIAANYPPPATPAPQPTPAPAAGQKGGDGA